MFGYFWQKFTRPIAQYTSNSIHSAHYIHSAQYTHIVQFTMILVSPVHRWFTSIPMPLTVMPPFIDWFLHDTTSLDPYENIVCTTIYLVQWSKVKSNAVQCSTLQCSAVHYTGKWKAIQCSAVHCSALQCSYWSNSVHWPRVVLLSPNSNAFTVAITVDSVFTSLH